MIVCTTIDCQLDLVTKFVDSQLPDKDQDLTAKRSEPIKSCIYPYILGGGFRLPGASGPLGHWPASANGASKSARKMTCKRLPKCARNGSRNEPKRLPATLLVASRITFQNRPLLRGSKM